MRKRRILYSKEAGDDLTAIGRRLTQFVSDTVARRFVSRIRQEVRGLEYASERGTIRDERRGLRLIGILPTVTLVFSVDADAVTIHRILYNGQNWTPDTD